MRATTAVVVAVASVVISACSREETPAANPPTTKATPAITATSDGQEIPEPASVSSKNGVLEYTVNAAPAQVTVAGRTFLSNVYNGSYLSPVLRLSRGDELRVTYTNNIDKADIEIDGPQSSNILALSPNEPADNSYISIPSSKAAGHSGPAAAGHDPALVKRSPTYEYGWRVPSNHPQGLYWFHPHAHGETESQILSGMSSLLVIEGLLEQHYPELAAAKHRTLILKDIDLPGAKDGDPKTKTINCDPMTADALRETNERRLERPRAEERLRAAVARSATWSTLHPSASTSSTRISGSCK